MNYSQAFFSRQFLWEIVRILTVGIASLLFYLAIIPLPALLAAMAFGLYSLVKTAVTDLVKERNIGTEIFITIAVIISVLGKESHAVSVVLMNILIAAYIRNPSREKSRASIKKNFPAVPLHMKNLSNGRLRFHTRCAILCITGLTWNCSAISILIPSFHPKLQRRSTMNVRPN